MSSRLTEEIGSGTIARASGIILGLLILLFSIPVLAQKFDPQVVYQKVVDGVVIIETPSGIGTGFFINEQGWIVTNYHVVQNSYTGRMYALEYISISTKKGTPILGVDIDDIKEEPHLDIALIKTNYKPKVYLSILTLVEPELLEDVLVIGHQAGKKWVPTTGKVNDVSEFIQSDVTANPGNSGGPLMNAHGQVVGVVTFKDNSLQNATYATKATDLWRLLHSRQIKYLTTPQVQSGRSAFDLEREELEYLRSSLIQKKNQLDSIGRSLLAEKDKFLEEQKADLEFLANSKVARRELENKELFLNEKEKELDKRELSLVSRESNLARDIAKLASDKANSDYLYPERFAMESSMGIGYWHIQEDVDFLNIRYSLSFLHRFDVTKRPVLKEIEPANRIGLQYGISTGYDGNSDRFLKGYLHDLSFIIDLRERYRFQIGRGFASKNEVFDNTKYWLFGSSYFFNLSPVPSSIYLQLLGDQKLRNNTVVFGLSIGYGNSFLRL